MSIFWLHEQVLNDYRDFVRSFFTVADDRARAFVEHALEDEARLWPDFLLQVSPSYAQSSSVEELVNRGELHADLANIFRTPEGRSFRLYQHQIEALTRASSRESYIVTSGTGSGKSLTYFLPIMNVFLREPPAGERVAALVVYPMNALVNSQLQALQSLKDGYERRTGKPFPISFGRYTGDTSEAARENLRQHPPKILLTNYVMAELMLVRPEDQRFLDRAGGGLRYLVFDELHTYRGRQGADVAMLIRRLKERCAAPGLVHVGTSATMVADRNATPELRRATVAEFAQRLFGHSFNANQVIEETLITFTEGGAPSRAELAGALPGSMPTGLPEFRRHAIARWAETEFGVEPEEGGHLRRRIPRTLKDAAATLAKASGVEVATCETRLRELLTRGGELAREDGGRVFAFKLHQFIGQGRALFATLESADQREFSMEGQIQAGGGRLFAPVKFCRQCGQDFYHTLRAETRFLPHPIGTETEDDESRPGYLMLAPPENDWSEELIPEEWRDSRGRLKQTWRGRVPEAIWVAPDGEFSSQSREGAVKMWWQPAPFHLCLGCGEFYIREREFAKLASISSEARSSATTVLATALLRHAVKSGASRDKLLTFTDNRQDASLQSGHFNDFVHLSLLRCALHAALLRERELRFDRVAREVVASGGLAIRDIARNAELDESSEATRDVRNAFVEVTEYRLYEDLRRGWRVVQPNLEHLGLLHVGYRGLEALCANNSRWGFHPAAAAMTVADRQTLTQALLDQFRRKLAISARCLQETQQQQIRRRAEQNLNDFWGLDPDVNELQMATRFVRLGRSQRAVDGFSLSERDRKSVV